MQTEGYIVAFTGHRIYDGSADVALCDTLHELYRRGARHFRVGMAEGFDISAGEAVVALMSEHEDIILELCIPSVEFARRFDAATRLRYDAIMERATIIRYSNKEYHPRIYHHRNNMLVDGAHYVVAWWNGSPSGTGYTVARARKQRTEVINLHPCGC